MKEEGSTGGKSNSPATSAQAHWEKKNRDGKIEGRERLNWDEEYHVRKTEERK